MVWACQQSPRQVLKARVNQRGRVMWTHRDSIALGTPISLSPPASTPGIMARTAGFLLLLLACACVTQAADVAVNG